MGFTRHHASPVTLSWMTRWCQSNAVKAPSRLFSVSLEAVSLKGLGECLRGAGRLSRPLREFFPRVEQDRCRLPFIGVAAVTVATLLYPLSEQILIGEIALGGVRHALRTQ